MRLSLLRYFLTGLLAIAVLTATVQAEEDDDLDSMPIHVMSDDDGGPGGKGLLSKVNLSEEQRKKIKEIREKAKADVTPKREALKAARAAFHQAMGPESSDADVLAKFDDFQGKRRDLARAKLERMLAVRAVLTPEQRKLMHATRQNKMDMRARQMERGHGKRMGPGGGDM